MPAQPSPDEPQDPAQAFQHIIELEDEEVIHQLTLWDDWMEGELDMY